MRNKSKINVLILFPDSYEKGLGGLSTHIQKLIKNFDESFMFYLLGYGGLPIDGENFIYRPIDGNYPYIDSWIMNSTDIIESFFKHYSQVKIDIVHVCDWNVFKAGKTISRLFKSKLLTAYHLPVFYYIDADSMDSILYKIQLESFDESDVIVFLSNNDIQIASVISNKNISKFKLVQNGIDMDDFIDLEIVKFDEYIEKRNKFLFIGRAVEQKGIYELLTTHFSEDEDFIFYLCPEHASDEEAIRMIKNQEAISNNVKYLGSLYGKDKFNLINSVDFVIMPSVYEPFGIVALEAMMAKKILITTGVDGMTDFVNKDNSILIKLPVHSSNIYDAVQRAKNLSKEEKIKIKQSAFQTAKKFSWEKTREEYKNIYNNLLNS